MDEEDENLSGVMIDHLLPSEFRFPIPETTAEFEDYPHLQTVRISIELAHKTPHTLVDEGYVRGRTHRIWPTDQFGEIVNGGYGGRMVLLFRDVVKDMCHDAISHMWDKGFLEVDRSDWVFGYQGQWYMASREYDLAIPHHPSLPQPYRLGGIHFLGRLPIW